MLPNQNTLDEVQCWWDVVEERPVTRILAPVITAYIRGLQNMGTCGEGVQMLLPDWEILNREWSQAEQQTTGTFVVANTVYYLNGVVSYSTYS